MKKLWNKNFFLGLGCGLILSFIIVSLIGPKVEQKTVAKVPRETIKQQASVGEAAYEPLQPPADLETVPETTPEAGQVKAIVKEVSIDIPKGATSSKIAKLLAAKEVVPDAEEFLQVVNDFKLANKFQPGVYRLKIGEDPLIILSTLTKREITKLKRY